MTLVRACLDAGRPQARMSREFALDIDPTGRVSWADERASVLAGLSAGLELLEVAVDRPRVERWLAGAGSAGNQPWVAREHLPNAILLDFVMPGMSAFDVLDELESQPRTREIPVFIHTSKDLAEHERTRLAREANAILNKQSLTREVAIARIRDALEKAGVRGGTGWRE